ncbi:MAG: hypothetical protein Q8P30_00780 [Candidatus Uhrbacteria bacterium]|nr:hypothetical protein [Candidatus Uhrbacteria bacterium]
MDKFLELPDLPEYIIEESKKPIFNVEFLGAMAFMELMILPLTVGLLHGILVWPSSSQRFVGFFVLLVINLIPFGLAWLELEDPQILYRKCCKEIVCAYRELEKLVSSHHFERAASEVARGKVQETLSQRAFYLEKVLKRLSEGIEKINSLSPNDVPNPAIQYICEIKVLRRDLKALCSVSSLEAMRSSSALEADTPESKKRAAKVARNVTTS